MKNTIKLFIIVILMSSSCLGQQQLDSLKNIWQNKKQSNSNRAKALNEFAEEYRKTDADSSLYYANKAYDFADSMQLNSYRSYAKKTMGLAYLKKGDYKNSIAQYKAAIEIARKDGDSTTVAISICNIGRNYYRQGDYDNAHANFQLSIEMFEALNDKEQLATVLSDISVIYIIQNNYPEAEKNLNRSIILEEEVNAKDRGAMVNLAILKSRQGDLSKAIELYSIELAKNEQEGNELNAAYCHINIATLYYDLDDREKFFEHINKSLEIRERLGDKNGVAKCLANLGEAYSNYNENEKALELLNRSLLISEEYGRKKEIARIVGQIGTIQIKTKNYQEAFNNLSRALKDYEELKNAFGIAKTQRAMGLYYKAIGKTDLALKYFNKSLAISKTMSVSVTKKTAFELYKLEDSLGNSKLALDAYKLYVSSKDSINTQDNKRAIIRQEYRYEYEKKAATDSIAFVSQKKIQTAKLKQTKNQRLYLLLGLLVVIGFTFWIFKQKNTIEDRNQKLNSLNENLEEKVEERTKEISKINKELTESDERYKYALDASNEGIWDWNLPTGVIKFSDTIYTMLGYEPNEFEESREAIYNLILEDDKSDWHKNNHEEIVLNAGDTTILDEYRMKKKNGEVIWVQVKAKVVERNKKGEPIRVVGTHSNITSDKIKNQEMLEAILKTEDMERSRISKDIHDGLQQTLTISLLNFQAVKKEIHNLGAKTIEKFNVGWKYLQESITDSREVAHTLMPKAIVDFGVISAFESLLDSIDKAQKDTTYNFYHNFKVEKLKNQQIEITLYRILQEALNNINKYAKATTVDIQLKEYNDVYTLTIEDNGVGFDNSILNKEKNGLGFMSMQNRLDAINGFLEIDSQIGRGTTILVEINKI